MHAADTDIETFTYTVTMMHSNIFKQAGIYSTATRVLWHAGHDTNTSTVCPQTAVIYSRSYF